MTWSEPCRPPQCDSIRVYAYNGYSVSLLHSTGRYICSVQAMLNVQTVLSGSTSDYIRSNMKLVNMNMSILVNGRFVASTQSVKRSLKLCATT